MIQESVLRRNLSYLSWSYSSRDWKVYNGKTISASEENEMKIKDIIKKMLCPIQCIRFHIKDREGNIYIGKACKIVNGYRMHFGNNVSIMPYSMLVCHNDGSIKIGEGSEIGMFSRIASLAEVTIGKNVLSGPHIFIADYNHEYKDVLRPIKYQGNMIKTSEKFDRGGGYYWR